MTPPPRAHYLVFSLCALQLKTYVYELTLHTYMHIYMQLEADHLTGHFSPIDTHTVSPEYKVDHLERYRVGVGPCAAILSIDLDIDYPPPPANTHTLLSSPGPRLRSISATGVFTTSPFAVLCVGLATQEGGCFLPPFSDTVIIVLQLSALIIVYKYCVFMGNW